MITLIVRSIIVVTMPTVASVHEEMHDETTQEKRKGQIGSKMLTVINDKIDTGCCKQDTEHPTNGGVFHIEEWSASFKAGIMHPDHVGASNNG